MFSRSFKFDLHQLTNVLCSPRRIKAEQSTTALCLEGMNQLTYVVSSVAFVEDMKPYRIQKHGSEINELVVWRTCLLSGRDEKSSV